jgi:DNA-binding LacI/PurR family transcriptional regulator
MSGGNRWLAERVAQEMRERLLKPLRPGGRLPSVRELAAELGVCVETVRAAQRLLADRGELEIRHGSGAYPPGRKAERCVGIVSELDLLHPRTSAFFPAVVRRLRCFFAASHVRTEFYMGESQPGERRERPTCGRLAADVAAGRLDGIVVVSAPETDSWRRFLDRLPAPFVGAGSPYVAGLDPFSLIRLGLRSLAAQGGRRVAILGWAERNTVDDAALASAAAEVGLETRPGWIRHGLHPQLCGAGWEEFREIWTACREKPDCLLATDDVLFAEATVAILEMGLRIPGQLRIAAHANAGAEPRVPFPLTLLRVDPAWGADQYGEMLVRLMDGQPVAAGLRLAPLEAVETVPGGVAVRGAAALRRTVQA